MGPWLWKWSNVSGLSLNLIIVLRENRKLHKVFHYPKHWKGKCSKIILKIRMMYMYMYICICICANRLRYPCSSKLGLRNTWKDKNFLIMIVWKCLSFDEFLNPNVEEHVRRKQLARCLSPLTSKLCPVGWGQQLDGWPSVLNFKLATHVNRVVVVDLSCASRVFRWVLRFSSLPKINT